MDKSRDQDRCKGTTEQDPQSEGQAGNTSMQGQLGHRDENAELKNADSIRHALPHLTETIRPL